MKTKKMTFEAFIMRNNLIVPYLNGSGKGEVALKWAGNAEEQLEAFAKSKLQNKKVDTGDNITLDT